MTGGWNFFKDTTIGILMSDARFWLSLMTVIVVCATAWLWVMK